jgi:hypothetical protein
MVGLQNPNVESHHLSDPLLKLLITNSSTESPMYKSLARTSEAAFKIFQLRG